MQKIVAPICLNLDNSILPITNNDKIFNLSEKWQELLRLTTTKKFFHNWQNFLQTNIFESNNKNNFHEISPIFFGSGDFHHLTYSFLKYLNDNVYKHSNKKITLIVLDNHPDNMYYPFGIHCGSWVYHASKLQIIKEIHMLGMTSTDISFSHCYETYLTPFLRKKLFYWSIKTSAKWLKFIGRNNQQQCFNSAEELITTFTEYFKKNIQNLVENNIYLSIDKDVLAAQFLTTNWDQGVFTDENLFAIIKLLKEHLIGIDICGEYSNYTYQSKIKKFFSDLDGQENFQVENTNDNIQKIHLQQQQLNQKIYSILL